MKQDGTCKKGIRQLSQQKLSKVKPHIRMLMNYISLIIWVHLYL